jgi:hypothetical protein
LKFLEEFVVDGHARHRDSGYPWPARQKHYWRPWLRGSAPEADQSDLNEAVGGAAAILPHPKMAQFGWMIGAVKGPKRIRFEGQIPGMMRLTVGGQRNPD